MCLEGQAQKIDDYILINDMPEDFEPKIGEFYNVKINEAHEYDLIGAIVRPSWFLQVSSEAPSFYGI